ncbi:GGDEF domain-containing protein [Aquabacterium sp.]|uniref:GGDEF domain-containing protein n=1 Tax=Aquabacterium sp. TaxID=1872578 RepID=UPI0035B4BD86
MSATAPPSRPLPPPAAAPVEASAAWVRPSPTRRLLGALGDLALSPDRKQRIRISRSLISMLVYVVCVLITGYGADNGLVEPGPVHHLQIGLVSWIVVVYTCLRSGFNERFADPALTLPQILGAQVWIAWSYVACAPFRGALMMLLALVLVFGIFNLNRLGRRVTNIYTVTLLGSVMGWMAWHDPAHYPPKVEFAHFVLMATILPVVSMLGAQLSDMRSKLKRQKNELTEALARIQEMATRDELTGLYNRRHMNEMLQQAIKQMERSGQTFSLCVIDLDHFKHVNDNHGHGAGDEVLRNFARLARQTLRETDALARWGGEEFLMLLPETRHEQGLIGIQRLRDRLRELVVVDHLPDLRVTFSAGLTEFRGGETIEQAVERADQALYQAKAGGRNCTRLI